MRYRICALLGVLVGAGAVGLLSSGVFSIVQVGTCASGGPYVIANECPSDIGWLMGRLGAGIVVLMLAVGLFGARGAPDGRPGGARSLPATAAFGAAAWGMAWLGIAVAVWKGAHSGNLPDSVSSSVTNTLVLVFGTMALVPLVGSLLRLFRGRARGSIEGAVGDFSANAPNDQQAAQRFMDALRTGGGRSETTTGTTRGAVLIVLVIVVLLLSFGVGLPFFGLR